ncbi:hypothetical protein C8Q76DRAFT_698531 [Earliella scabrosa]|nr:hypothetical protein C8Q76DRAFT_698531 [Earliella scabrosa]
MGELALVAPSDDVLNELSDVWHPDASAKHIEYCTSPKVSELHMRATDQRTGFFEQGWNTYHSVPGSVVDHAPHCAVVEQEASMGLLSVAIQTELLAPQLEYLEAGEKGRYLTVTGMMGKGISSKLVAAGMVDDTDVRLSMDPGQAQVQVKTDPD